MQLGTWSIPLLPAVAVGVAVVLVCLVVWGVLRARSTTPGPAARRDEPDLCDRDWTGEAAGGAADPPPPERLRTVAEVVAARGADTAPMDVVRAPEPDPVPAGVNPAPAMAATAPADRPAAGGVDASDGPTASPARVGLHRADEPDDLAADDAPATRPGTPRHATVDPPRTPCPAGTEPTGPAERPAETEVFDAGALPRENASTGEPSDATRTPAPASAPTSMSGRSVDGSSGEPVAPASPARDEGAPGWAGSAADGSPGEPVLATSAGGGGHPTDGAGTSSPGESSGGAVPSAESATPGHLTGAVTDASPGEASAAEDPAPDSPALGTTNSTGDRVVPDLDGDDVEPVEPIEPVEPVEPDVTDVGPVPPPWSPARSAPAAGSAETVSFAVQQALAARAVQAARARGDVPDLQADEVPAPGTPDARDRLLSVLLTDPADALGATTDLDDTRERIDQLGDVLRRRRADLASAVRRLHRSGLTGEQIGQLAGLGGDDVRVILERASEEGGGGR